MQSTTSKGRLLYLAGAIIVIIFGLLAAFTPNFGYVTVFNDFLWRTVPESNLPRVVYPSFEFSIYVYTLPFIIVALIGVLGVFSLIGRKSKQFYLDFLFITLGNIAFWIPPETRFMIPEVTYADLPWIGSLFVIGGISIFFIGLALDRQSVPRFTLLSVPLLLGVFVTYYLLIIGGKPFLLGTLTFHFSWQYTITNLLFFLFVAAQLLMIFGAYKALKSGLEELKQNVYWSNVK